MEMNLIEDIKAFLATYLKLITKYKDIIVSHLFHKTWFTYFNFIQNKTHNKIM